MPSHWCPGCPWRAADRSCRAGRGRRDGTSRWPAATAEPSHGWASWLRLRDRASGRSPVAPSRCAQRVSGPAPGPAAAGPADTTTRGDSRRPGRRSVRWPLSGRFAAGSVGAPSSRGRWVAGGPVAGRAQQCGAPPCDQVGGLPQREASQTPGTDRLAGPGHWPSVLLSRDSSVTVPFHDQAN
jgi:hypothetical protein